MTLDFRIKELSALIQVCMKRKSWLELLFLCISCVSLELASTQVMFVISSFYESIISGSRMNFFYCLCRAVIILTGISLLKALADYAAGVCARAWRENLVLHLHECQCNQLNEQLDNIDQRIAVDAKTFCESLAKCCRKLIPIPIVIVYYSTILVTLLSWEAPMMCFAYFVLSSLLSSFVMLRLAEINCVQNRLEGGYRYLHACRQMNRSEIWFLRGEEYERGRLNKALHAVLENLLVLLRWELFLGSVVSWLDYFGSIVNYLIVGYLVLWSIDTTKANAADIAVLISRSSFACLYLISSLFAIVQATQLIAILTGDAMRIYPLMFQSNGDCDKVAALDAAREVDSIELPLLIGAQSSSTSNSSLESRNPRYSVTNAKGDVLLVDGLILSSPGSLCCRLNSLPLSLKVQMGDRVLVSGPSGVGKSTLLRCLAGSPLVAEGQAIFSIAREEVLFLPQNPYCFEGSLLQNIAYPGVADSMDGRLEEMIQEIGLMKSLFPLTKERMLINRNWPDILSKGEQQKLAALRACYMNRGKRQVTLLCLDEASSNLDEDSEKQVYDAFVKYFDCIISVGHRESLKRYHNKHVAMS